MPHIILFGHNVIAILYLLVSIHIKKIHQYWFTKHYDRIPIVLASYSLWRYCTSTTVSDVLCKYGMRLHNIIRCTGTGCINTVLVPGIWVVPWQEHLVYLSGIWCSASRMTHATQNSYFPLSPYIISQTQVLLFALL